MILHGNFIQFYCFYHIQRLCTARTLGRYMGFVPQTVDKGFMPYNNQMTNRSVRQIVKVSIGGPVIRLQLSNELSSEPVEITSVLYCKGWRRVRDTGRNSQLSISVLIISVG